MPISIANVNPTSDTFQSWVTRTNQIADSLSTVVMTTAANTIGGQNSANAYVNGIFSANTIAVTQFLRGGTVASAANLYFSSNVHFNSVGNVSSNSTYLNLKSAIGTITTTTLTLDGTSVVVSSNLNVKNNSLVVAAAGRVSINTSSADAALTVVGTANVSGNTRIGGITTLAANVLVQSNTTLSMIGAETTGYLFFGNTGTRSLSYDGAKYTFAVANVSVEGVLLCGANVAITSKLNVVDNATFVSNVSANNLLLTHALSVDNGGTGATTAAAARSNLGLGSITTLDTISSAQFTSVVSLAILDSAGSTLKTLYASAS